jgi:hypothetical protein
MIEQDLIKFKELSMQDGRLNLQWFAEYVAQAEREKCAKLCEEMSNTEANMNKTWRNGCSDSADAIRARGGS